MPENIDGANTDVQLQVEDRAEPDFFNVFATHYELMDNEYFHGSNADARILYKSKDGRHLAIASRYPNGVRFRYGGHADYREVFYVVRGHGSRGFSDGSSVDIAVGDFIYVRPGVEIDYHYAPGFIDVALFWSDTGPLDASLAGGVARSGISE